MEHPKKSGQIKIEHSDVSPVTKFQRDLLKFRVERLYNFQQVECTPSKNALKLRALAIRLSPGQP